MKFILGRKYKLRPSNEGERWYVVTYLGQGRYRDTVLMRMNYKPHRILRPHTLIVTRLFPVSDIFPLNHRHWFDKIVNRVEETE